MTKPAALDGIKVLDLSRVLAGPWCTQILADLGADVVKIERPGVGDDTRTWGPPFIKDANGNDTDQASYFTACNRNKRSVTIDMATPEGQALMKQMATRHHASALWVEVDPEMRKNYEKAGFVDFATPNRDDPAQLTMMVLPLSNEMKKRLGSEEGKAKVWDEHITSWYKANWDSLKGPDAAPAQDALAKMRADLKNGQRTWFQALPE